MTNLNQGLMFVDQLEKVVQTGAGRWLACCPAHADKSPSLSIRQLEDGRVLLNCFAGCTAEEIVESVGLSMQQLFPDDSLHYRPRYSKKVQMTVDDWTLEIAQADREAGHRLSDKDKAIELAAFKRARGG